MDTRDKQFQSAYNDLVNAFFRFINVVNPAPTRDAQIRIICESMTALVNMIEGKPGAVSSIGQSAQPNVVPEAPYTPETPITPVEPIVDPAEPVSSSASSWGADQQAGVSTSTGSAYPDKRYAPFPTFTAEEIYKFISRSMKKQPAYEAAGSDVALFPFYVEFNETEGVGVFTINPDGLAQSLRSQVNNEVIEIGGASDGKDVTIIEPGQLVKSSGGWKVTSPLKISLK